MRQTSKRDVVVLPNLDALSQEAAHRLLSAADEASRTRGIFHLVLSGGGTPRHLYRKLAKPPLSLMMPWSDVHFYWGDERCVPPDHGESNYGQARDILIKNVPVRDDNIHRIKGELTPKAAASDYRSRLREMSSAGQDWPEFDLVLLGLGDDGHTASLFPGHLSQEEQDRPVLAVTAEYGGRPADRVTLTPLALNSARQVIFLVSGRSKAEALSAALGEKNDPIRWPSQRIKPIHGPVTWLVDQDALGSL
jgi:6-phosphogluconolactonase